MDIIVAFENGDDYWQNLVTTNAAKASAILSDPAFLAWVRSQPSFDFTELTPVEVAEKIERSGDIKIRVGFYAKRFTRAIAYEVDGEEFFNTDKEAYGSGGVGNIAHETMHALGFSHDGNSPEGNQQTVPWAIGNYAETWGKPAEEATPQYYYPNAFVRLWHWVRWHVVKL